MRRTYERKTAEIVIKTFRKLCETSDRAPSPSSVFKYLEQKHSGVSRQWVAQTLLDYSADGNAERKEVGQYTFYRIPGLRAEFPVDHDELVTNAVITFNKAGKMPCNADIARAVGCSCDTSLKAVKRLCRRDKGALKAIRVPGAKNIYQYVSTLPEFSKLYALQESFEVMTQYGSSIIRQEWQAARRMTKPGDVIKTTIGDLPVRMCAPHLCVFDAYSVKWSDVALFYRNHAPIEIRRRTDTGW